MTLYAVCHHTASQQAYFGARGEGDCVGLAVVNDGFRLALCEFVEAFPFLAEKYPLAGLGP